MAPLARRVSKPAVLVASVALLAVFAAPLAAQTASLGGRVVGEDGASGVPQASVELEGVGVRVTSGDGSFRFEDVAPGEHVLRVSALGYATATRPVRVLGETTVTVQLAIRPIPLDSIPVDVRLIDVEGHVLDRSTGRDVVVVDAQVRTDRTAETYTDSHGRFELENVAEGVSLRIEVRAFGYLPADRTVVAAEDDDYVFELEPDAFVRQMIEVQVRRLEERSETRRGVMVPMDRLSLLRYAGSATLLDVLAFEYRTYLPRLRCGLIDDVNIYTWSEFRAIAGHLLPEEVERIEFIAGEPHPDSDGHLPVFQIRVYTRAFIQRMITDQQELRAPIFNTLVSPPICR